jgi:hypothetical protein
MGFKRTAEKVLFGKPEGNGRLGRPRRELQHNIKMVLHHKVCEDMGWVHLARKVTSDGLGNDFPSSIKRGESLDLVKNNGSFRRTLLN